MLPDGAAPFAGKNSEDVVVKFDQEGVDGIKCTPHYGMGMVAIIVAGNPANEDQAKQVFATLFGKLDGSKTAAR